MCREANPSSLQNKQINRIKRSSFLANEILLRPAEGTKGEEIEERVTRLVLELGRAILKASPVERRGMSW